MSVTLANGGASDRKELDYYPTPPEVTLALALFLRERYNIASMTCLEPACGDGIMSEVLSWFFRKVVSSDIRHTGYGCGGVDYLAATSSGFHCIITNPPFSLSEQFIKKALSESTMVAMLLKSQYWHAERRRGLFFEHVPAYILPLTWRPDFYFGAKSGSPTMEVFWTVWHRGQGMSKYLPLERPTRAAVRFRLGGAFGESFPPDDWFDSRRRRFR